MKPEQMQGTIYTCQPQSFPQESSTARGTVHNPHTAESCRIGVTVFLPFFWMYGVLVGRCFDCAYRLLGSCPPFQECRSLTEIFKEGRLMQPCMSIDPFTPYKHPLNPKIIDLKPQDSEFYCSPGIHLRPWKGRPCLSQVC